LFPKVHRETNSFGFGTADKVSVCQGLDTRLKHIFCLQHICKLASPVGACSPVPGCASVFVYVGAYYKSGRHFSLDFFIVQFKNIKREARFHPPP